MTNKTLKNALVYLSLLLFPVLVSAQEKGIDQKIDEAFKPIADWWGWLIFYPIYDGIPLVLVVLIFGAAFFTVVFGFINITKFWLMAMSQVIYCKFSLKTYLALSSLKSFNERIT